MFLLINTSEKSKIHLSLFDERSVIRKSYSGQNRELLSCIDKMARVNHLTPCPSPCKGEGKLKPPSLPSLPAGEAGRGTQGRSITGIAVVVGAGGFTSTRVACVVANTFAYVLRIPLLAVTKDQASDPQKLIPKLLKQKPGNYISATYSGEANIGRKK